MSNHLHRITKLCGTAVLVVSLSGCLGGDSLNTETAEYVPETRPLNVIAPDNLEVMPGATVTLSSRLVGTVDGQTLMWTQIAGTEVSIVDPTAETISFTVPDSLLAGLLVFQVAAMNADGTNATDADGNPLADTVEVTVFDPNSVVVLDVSDATTTLNGASLVAPGDDQFILGAFNERHTADLEPGMSVTFNIDNLAGFFTLNVRYAIPSDYGGKVAGVDVNGVGYELTFDATGAWEEMRVGVVELVDGNNTIEVGGGWNYYRIDSISLIPSSEPPPPQPVAPTLVNTNATEATVNLMTFLSETYLQKTISGQTEFPRRQDDTFPLIETQKILDATGGDDAPAIVAFDFMNYSASYAGGNGDHTGLSEAMIGHHQDRNVILSALWHWRAPSGNSGSGDGSFYTDGTSFDFAAALADTSSAEYAALLVDIDTIATELQKFADRDIPILWRPLHEAAGGWFWWGAQGADAFKQLWTLMYDRMTNMHGLNNLIWVYTHTDRLAEDWYPGNDMVDIVGFDGYADPRNDDSHTFVGAYNTLKDRYDGEKMVALTETGTIPDVSLMHEQGAMWLFFITWNSEFWDANSVIGPQGADPAEVDANYAFDGVLNLAEVPSTQEKVSGTYADFEFSTYDWEGQVNWSPTEGLHVADGWARSGLMALSLNKDLSSYETMDNVVFQTYPDGGLDVTGMVALNVYVHAADAGDSVNAHIFYKAGEDDVYQSWPGATNLDGGMTMLTTSLTELPDGTGVELASLNGFGVRFQGMDASQTSASFYLDRVEAVDADGTSHLLYDFEPDTGAWHGQINWGTTSGTTLSNAWSEQGGRSFALYKDLSQYESIDNAVLQAYPEGGIDVSGYSAIKVYAETLDAGDAVDAHIFFKAGEGDAYQSWPASTMLVAGGTELSIDLTDQLDADNNPVVLETLNGMGVRFQNIDGTSSNAKFMIDAIVGVADDGSETLLFNFENTGEFELQLNWAPAPGLQLANDWAAQGYQALAGFISINDGEQVILQTYPAGGILLADGISILSLSAFVENASEGVTAKLWAKDQDGVWRDAGATSMTAEGVNLSLDISDLNELQGFGVQFEGLTSNESKYYIDNVVFE